VQRLTSMSVGKNLSPLSFIFALQRPLPFYAFDEDMFFRCKQQATLAQFIVVSLRRPMIESAERTIGVTREELYLLGLNCSRTPRPEVLLIIVLTN